MMGRTELAIGHAGAHAAQHDMIAVIGDVGLHLLERAAGQEGRCAADERHEAAIRKAGGDADHVLLGDADIDEAVRERLLEAPEIGRADAVVADGDDALIRLRELDQRLGEGLAAVEGGGRGGDGGVHQRSSSSARATCSADGTL